MKKLLILAVGDLKNIARDATLLLILFGPVAIFLLLRFAMPVISKYVLDQYDFSLYEYYPIIVCFMSMIPTMLFGLIFGLLILDERDEEIIAFIAVTPLRKSGYLAYKLSSSYVLGFISCIAILSGTALIQLHPHQVLLLAFVIAIEAPIASLFLAAFAEDKVAGLAFGKIIGIMYIAPFIVFFVNSNWQLLAAALPPFWIAKAFIAAMDNNTFFWYHIAIGFTVHMGFALILIKKFLFAHR
ncbi:MAG: hypothetical protein DWQ10_00225 [Calditrichaeota bacterium]|nr:MAG: hypothetical protein DWQ10_00225 [Calditrichota bacterium]